MLLLLSWLSVNKGSLLCVVRVKRLRDKYEAELRELQRSERAAVEKQQELRRQQIVTEGELISLQAMLGQKEQEMEDVTQVERKSLSFVNGNI